MCDSAEGAKLANQLCSFKEGVIKLLTYIII